MDYLEYRDAGADGDEEVGEHFLHAAQVNALYVCVGVCTPKDHMWMWSMKKKTLYRVKVQITVKNIFFFARH